MDSDEDDEEPQHEPGTSSNSQTTVPVLPLQQRPAASSQGPAASSQGPAASANTGDEDNEFCDEYSAQSTLYRSYVPTYDEHWDMTPETHKYAAGARSLCFVAEENGRQQDIYNLTTVPCVQRSLYLKEMTNDFSHMYVEVPKGVHGRT